jgi:hypothetical protein
MICLIEGKKNANSRKGKAKQGTNQTVSLFYYLDVFAEH